MKTISAVLEGKERLVLREFDLPAIKDDDGLLKVERAGICQTDHHLFHGKTMYAPYPLIMGHEIMGHIAALGPVAARRWGVREGDRVIVQSVIRCGYCRYCLIGEYRFCEQQAGYGTRVSASTPPHLWGSYGQHMYLAPGTVLHKIPEDMPTDLAVLINVIIANGIQWGLLDGGIKLGDAVVVQGVGPLGLSCVAAAREAGASPIIATGLEVDAPRLALAATFGADATINVEREDPVERVRELTGGRMADVVVDVTGSPKAIATSIELIRPLGTVVNCGVTGDETRTPLFLDRLLYKAGRIQAVFASDVRAVARAIELAKTRRYPFERLVTHVFPLEQAERAVRTAGREFPGQEPLKVTIRPE